MPDDIDYPAPPSHPPPSSDVPVWVVPTDPRSEASEEESAVFVDSTGSVTTDILPDGVDSVSTEEVVRTNFVRLRKDKGWTQEGTAHRLTDVSHGQEQWSHERVKRIESGRYKSFKTTDLFTFCHAFGVPLWELLLPAEGEVVSYASNLVDRGTSAELLFHIDSGVLDRDGLDEEIGRALKQARDAKWRKRWTVIEEHWHTVEEGIRQQLDSLRELEFSEHMNEMAELEKGRGTDDGAHS